MNLVYQKGGQVVTDSVTLAEAFGKRHDKVLRDIRQARCSDAFRQHNFIPHEYENKQGRKMPAYILTYEGLAFIGMSYNGEQADQLKELFLNQFKVTKRSLERQVNIEDGVSDQVMIEDFKDRITLNHDDQKAVSKAVRDRLYELYPSLSTNARAKYFSMLYGDLRASFEVNSYRDIKEHELDDCMDFIRKWTRPLLESRA